jgi:streptomycin 6-kinase
MDDKLKYYKQLWSLLDDGEPFTTYSGLLQPVVSQGVKCMLKIARREKDKPGNSLMAWWKGDGAAPILRYDDTAILMERATGSHSLAEMAKTGYDDEASRVICSVVARLHAHQAPYPKGLVPLDIWFKSLYPAAAGHGGIFVPCSQITNMLLDKPMDQVVLHGDIHHGNILDFGAKGWLAIDPKGLLGEQGFDYANLFCNPDIATATAPRRLLRQVDIISKEAGMEHKRLLQWIVAWSGLSAAWAMEDGVSAEPAMTIAKMAVQELSL